MIVTYFQLLFSSPIGCPGQHINAQYHLPETHCIFFSHLEILLKTAFASTVHKKLIVDIVHCSAVISRKMFAKLNVMIGVPDPRIKIMDPDPRIRNSLLRIRESVT